MPATTFNIIISGVSVSGAIDTAVTPLRIFLGNSDKIGYVDFALQNKDTTYTNLTVSGNATCQIDAQTGGAIQTIFGGTIEEVENQISIQHGSVSTIKAYDKGIELLGVVSPDARLPYLNLSGFPFNILSGDGGIASLEGMELTKYVSGINPGSGAMLSSFLSQYFGASGNETGSWSGKLFSFKPYISGYNLSGWQLSGGVGWRTYYVPDASGFVGANDNNNNYWIAFDTFKVKREYAWDVLRKIVRNNLPVISGNNRVQLEVYIGVSGDIHVFGSGSYEFLASGVVLQYYAPGTSGATLNNLLDAKIPFRSINVKNYIAGWFPAWSIYPEDLDYFSDIFSISGFASGMWTATTGGVLSGDSPASSIGQISIQGGWAGGNVPSVGATTICTLPGSGTSAPQTINIRKWNLSGKSASVSINYFYRFDTNANGMAYTSHGIALQDTSGGSISKFGSGNQKFSASLNNTSGAWTFFTDTIYNTDGSFNSGTGSDGGWSPTASADLTRINQLQFRLGPAAGMTSGLIGIDNIYFSFNYPISPVTAYNSGSVGMGYGRRYSIVEFPYEVSDIMASGVMNQELNSRMGQKGLANFVVKDNPLLPVPAQLNIKPGQVFIVDAPSLNTGSGQTFNYWRAIDVMHEWSHSKGFITTIQAVPHTSGTVTAPNSNIVDYELPLRYEPPPKRILTMPVTYPWFHGDRR